MKANCAVTIWSCCLAMACGGGGRGPSDDAAEAESTDDAPDALEVLDFGEEETVDDGGTVELNLDWGLETSKEAFGDGQEMVDVVRPDPRVDGQDAADVGPPLDDETVASEDTLDGGDSDAGSEGIADTAESDEEAQTVVGDSAVWLDTGIDLGGGEGDSGSSEGQEDIGLQEADAEGPDEFADTPDGPDHEVVDVYDQGDEGGDLAQDAAGSDTGEDPGIELEVGDAGQDAGGEEASTDVSAVGDAVESTSALDMVADDSVPWDSSDIEIGLADSKDTLTLDTADLDAGEKEDTSQTGPHLAGECPAPYEPPEGEPQCSIQQGTGSSILLHVDALVPDGILRGAWVLVGPAGAIRCVGCDCAETEGALDATVVQCGRALVTPGLINTHDHLSFAGNTPNSPGSERYDHRHEWRKGLNGHTKISVESTPSARAMGEVRMLMGGATAIFGSGGADGILRNLDGDMEGLPKAWEAYYSTFPLGDAKGVMLEDSCQYPKLPYLPAVEQDHCYGPHVAEGVNEAAHNEFLCLSGAMPDGVDVVEPNAFFIHGMAVDALDVAAMALDSTGLSWALRSNLSLYGNTAPVTEYAALGVTIALGTDWIVTGSMNLLRELHCADEFNERNLGGYFTDRELVDMVTANAAAVMHLDRVLGHVAPGYLADLALFDASSHHDERAVIDATPADVMLVLRGGIPLYGDADIMEGLGAVGGCEMVDVCGRQKRICAERETGKSLAELTSGDYPLFSCATPPNEPTCVPSRPGEYEGIPTADDSDGDGIVDELDDCPGTFNPVRPMDLGAQRDQDNDGLGDECDPCPITPGSKPCPLRDPRDPDGDGIPTGLDNCPFSPNPGQADADGDFKGDACDDCPFPNIAIEPCPVSIYAIKQGTVGEGSQVLVFDAVVTAIGHKGDKTVGFFMQHPQDSAVYQGAGYSGIFCYLPDPSKVPEPGQLVRVLGTVNDYWGQIQLASIQDVTVIGQYQGALEPILVDPADIATGGQLSEVYEGVLVQVRNVVVTEVEPEPGPGDSFPTYEFVVDGVLRVDDFIYRVDPLPAVGTGFQSITGVSRLGNGNYKLEPRGPEDLVLQPKSE